MQVLKSTHEILNSPWDFKTSPRTLPTHFKKPPSWDKDVPPTINDIMIWERLFYQPGSIGLYVAWSPYAEFYMIVHNLFLNDDKSIETFFGNDAYLEAKKRMSDFNIDITENNIKV